MRSSRCRAVAPDAQQGHEDAGRAHHDSLREQRTSGALTDEDIRRSAKQLVQDLPDKRADGTPNR